MTAGALTALRAYNVTLGRFAVSARMLRWALVTGLVTRRADTYVPASRSFDPKELG